MRYTPLTIIYDVLCQDLPTNTNRAELATKIANAIIKFNQEVDAECSKKQEDLSTPSTGSISMSGSNEQNQNEQLTGELRFLGGILQQQVRFWNAVSPQEVGYKWMDVPSEVEKCGN